MNEKAPYIEIGIIFALRVYFGVQVSLSLLSLWGQAFLDREPALQDSLEIDVIRISIILILFFTVAVPAIPQFFGKYFLPGVLVVTVVETFLFVLASLLIVEIPPDSTVEGNIILRSTQVMLILFVPLIVTAWQYSYRAVVGFIFSNGVLMTVLTVIVLDGEPFTLALITLIIFYVMMYSIVGYTVAWLMNVQRKQRAALMDANEKVRRYAITLEQLAISRERNRLARELHDTLAHTLSGLSVQLEATDALLDREPERARHLLHDALKSARSGMVDTRQALHALRAAPLEDLGLILSLESMARDVASRGTLKIDCQLPEQLPDLPVGADHVVYRVVQEALTNIARHANAENAKVVMVQKQNQVVIEISDDGDGFDPDSVDTNLHLGLQGMRERVSMIGGEIEISSRAGEGTRIKILLETLHDKSTH